MRRFAPQPAPGPYPFSLIARRAVLGGMVLAGLFLVIGTELRHALTGEDRSAAAAVKAFTDAVERYPHLPALRTERALALHAAGEPKDAAAEARVALQLDELNRRRGHRDKELPPAVRVELRRVISADD